MPELIDPFGRKITYLRVSLTDRCNMRCFYCLPRDFRDFQEKENLLKDDQLLRVIAAFGELGVSRFRLTGGEPLIRPQVSRLVADLSAIPGVEDLSMSTNASLLEKYAVALKQAGLNRINVSLDSLDPEKFLKVTGGRLEPVLEGLQAAKEAGISPIKINMLAMRGINDDEVEDMVLFCLENGFTLRFIETMPMGTSGLTRSDHYLPLSIIRAQLESRFELIPTVMKGNGPARYVQVKGSDLKIGFITPISQHFCETCNRVRLTADGTLYLCLGQENSYPLGSLLKRGISDEGLKNSIREALLLKPLKHDFVTQPGRQTRIMSITGG